MSPVIGQAKKRTKTDKAIGAVQGLLRIGSFKTDELEAKAYNDGVLDAYNAFKKALK